jgi:D-alanyl-D-alanine carboxypeptidase
MNATLSETKPRPLTQRLMTCAAVPMLTSAWLLLAPPVHAQSTAANLQAALDQGRAQAGIVGASATVIGPGLAWTGASGLSDRASAIRIRPEMIFGVGSITKSFTAALILQLSEEGALSLDDTLGQWLPAVAANPALHIPGAVTIRQLLNHTSGINELTDNNEFISRLLADPAKRLNPEDGLSYVQAPYFPPGASWHYSNTNYILLGLIAERAANALVVNELQRRFFTPLGLRGTFLQGEEAVIGEITHGHTGAFGVPKQDISSWPRTALNSVAWTAGAIVSTSEDLAHWTQALLSGGILLPESLQQLLTFVATGDAGLEYGLGIGRQQDPQLGEIWFHTGNIFGYQGIIAYAPASRTSVAVLANDDSGNIGSTWRTLLSTAAAATRSIRR